MFGLPIRLALTRAVAAACLIYLAAGFLDFGNYRLPNKAQLASAKVAVVLGGGEARISAGLKLMHSGEIARFFISGENLELYKTFVSVFSSKNPEIPDIAHMLDCCIEWSRRAQNTIENAMETKCWLKTSATSEPIVLITSPEHMSRALFLFSKELGRRTIIPYPAVDYWNVKPEKQRTRDFALEYVKYLCTQAYYWLMAIEGRGLSPHKFC